MALSRFLSLSTFETLNTYFPRRSVTECNVTVWPSIILISDHTNLSESMRMLKIVQTMGCAIMILLRKEKYHPQNT